MFKHLMPLLLLAAAPLFAQQPQQIPPVGERVDVNLVQLDAVVTDAKGNQILGLGKDDFIVRENGVDQPVDAVDYFTNRTLLDAPESNANFKVDRVHRERYLILFFDKGAPEQTQSEIIRARSDAAKFIDEWLRPEDRVAVVGHGVRLTVYSDFTNDKAQIHRALNDATAFGLGIRSKSDASGDMSLLRNLDVDEMINHTGTVYEALNVLADAVRPIRGRKDLVLFSPGIVAHDEEVRNGAVMSRSRYYEPMIHALNAANVTVYPISMQPGAGEAFVHQSLASIADETNGEYYRLHTSYMSPLRQIEKKTAGYYLISYYTKKRQDVAAGFQKVDVTLRNPEFRVKARAGYTFE
jgi:VWFA-related protein